MHADNRDAVWNDNACQSRAARESTSADYLYAFWNDDAGQASAAFENLSANFCYAVWNYGLFHIIGPENQFATIHNWLF